MINYRKDSMDKIIKIAALYIKNKKLLLARSKNQSVFFTVGGKIESGETELECLHREVMEEVGCHIKNAEYFQTFEGIAHNKGVNVVLICYLVELDEQPSPQSEIAEIVWWGSSSTVELSDMLKIHILPALRDKLE